MISKEFLAFGKDTGQLLCTLRRNLPLILLGAGFVLFGSGCVINPHVGDVLAADRNVSSGFCPIKPGTLITLNSQIIAPIAGAANQADLVWSASVPGCGDIAIADSTVRSGFTRVKP